MITIPYKHRLLQDFHQITSRCMPQISTTFVAQRADKCHKLHCFLPHDHATLVARRGTIDMAQTIVDAVKSKIFGHGRGWVFTPHHFNDLGSYTGVRTALSRLQKERIIRRVSQGIYDYPRIDETLGILSPPVEAVARAIAEKNGAKIQPTGAYAANLIGLSEQVPGRVVFLTDGPIGKVKIKKLEVTFRKTTVKNMHAAGSREALVIQAFKFMGKQHINQIMLETTKRFLKGVKRKDFEKNIKYAPHWIRVILFDLLEKDL